MANRMGGIDQTRAITVFGRIRFIKFMHTSRIRDGTPYFMVPTRFQKSIIDMQPSMQNNIPTILNSEMEGKGHTRCQCIGSGFFECDTRLVETKIDMRFITTRTQRNRHIMRRFIPIAVTCIIGTGIFLCRIPIHGRTGTIKNTSRCKVTIHNFDTISCSRQISKFIITIGVRQRCFQEVVIAIIEPHYNMLESRFTAITNAVDLMAMAEIFIMPDSTRQHGCIARLSAHEAEIKRIVALPGTSCCIANR